MKIVSEELKEPLIEVPVKDGKFSWDSEKKIDLAFYSLIIDKKQYPFVLSKGDKIFFYIKTDPKHFEVILKGTRKAEDQYIISKSGRFSMFYSFIVADKQFTNDPEKFYEAAGEEWEDAENYLDSYRTKENIYFASDFRKFQQQKNAVNLLNAIYNYQKMTSFTDKKFTPPTDLIQKLQDIVKKPVPMLLSNEDYKTWKIKEWLPKDGTKNPDSIIFVKLSQMPKSLEKDQLLSFQMLKMMSLIKDESQRNQLFNKKLSEFQNSKYRIFVNNQLNIINNQQKGKPFPTVVFENESGKKESLAKFKGKYIIMDLWATWCAPCRETSPVFEYQANKYSYNDKIVFLSASIDSDKNKWKLDMKNKKSAVIQWWISDPNILNYLGVKTIPRFIMIDPAGNIYNANLPRPDETNFTNIVDDISN
ncbi:MAG: TlpA disulfide reductase family protein [Chryseobacterium sp.]